MADEPSSLVLFALSFGVLLTFVLFLWAINALKARLIMSRLPSQPAGDSVPELVPVPVAATGSSEVVPTNPGVKLPDTTALEGGTEAWELPRVSRYLDDPAIVVMLASQKRSGKYRFSANDMVRLIGGNRAEVLAIIRQVRETPATFLERSAEQVAARAELGL